MSRPVNEVGVRDLVGLVARVPDPRQKAALSPKLAAYMAEAQAQELAPERLEAIVADLKASDSVKAVLEAVGGGLTSGRYLNAVLRYLLEFWDASGPTGGAEKPLASSPRIEQRRSAEDALAWDLINRS